MEKKATYRNAIRSRMSIQDAFIQLMLKIEPIHIKVCDVIDLANVSKGTFYAHYTCLYDVQQAVEDEQIKCMFQVMESPVPPQLLDHFYLLFLSGLKQMEEKRELFRVLFRSSYGNSFLIKVKQTFLTHMINYNALSTLENVDKAKLYLTYVAGGAITVIQEWLEDSQNMSAESVARFLSDVAVNGIDGIKKGR